MTLCTSLSCFLLSGRQTQWTVKRLCNLVRFCQQRCVAVIYYIRLRKCYYILTYLLTYSYDITARKQKCHSSNCFNYITFRVISQ